MEVIRNMLINRVLIINSNGIVNKVIIRIVIINRMLV